MGHFEPPNEPYLEEGLWERFGVKFGSSDQEDEISHFSPWEIRTEQNLDRLTFDSSTIDPENVNLLKSAVAAAVVQPQWAVFQIAPAPKEAYETSSGQVQYYNTIVPLPLALTDIVGRLDAGYYRQMAALVHDIATISRNAVTFNGENDAISTDAKNLEEFLRAVLDGSSNAADAEVYANQGAEEEDDDEPSPPPRTRARISYDTRRTQNSSGRRRGTRARRGRVDDSITEEESDSTESSYSSDSSSSSSDGDEASPTPRQARNTRIRLRT